MGVVPSADTYVFPLCQPAVEPWCNSGVLYAHVIRVSEIRRAERMSRATVGATKSPVHGSLGENDQFAWTSIEVGDFLTIGEHRHKVVSIVPRDRRTA